VTARLGDLVRSAGAMAFVNQSVEALLTPYRSWAGRGRRPRWVKVKRKMGSLLVVVIDVLPKNHLHVALAEDEQPVQGFVAKSLDHALAMGVGSRAPVGCEGDPLAVAAEHLIELVDELGIASPLCDDRPKVGSRVPSAESGCAAHPRLAVDLAVGASQRQTNACAPIPDASGAAWPERRASAQAAISSPAQPGSSGRQAAGSGRLTCRRRTATWCRRARISRSHSASELLRKTVKLIASRSSI